MIPTTCPDCGGPTYERGVARYCYKLGCTSREIPYTPAELLAIAERNAQRVLNILRHTDTFAENIHINRAAVNNLLLSTQWLIQQTKEESQ